MTSGAEYPGVPLLKLLTCESPGSSMVLMPKSVILAMMPWTRDGSICGGRQGQMAVGADGEGDRGQALPVRMKGRAVETRETTTNLEQHVLWLEVSPDDVLRVDVDAALAHICQHS